MSNPVGKALVALQAALFARELYGVGHAAIAKPAAGAAELLVAALGGSDSIGIMLIEQRIVFAGAVLLESTALNERLIPRLHASGVSSLTFTRGVTMFEVVQVADQLTDAGGKPCEGTPHIRFGRVVVAGNTEMANLQPMAEVGRGVGDLLTKTRQGEAVDQQTLEGVIGAICAAVAVGRGAMLPLAAIRNHDEYTYLHTVNVGVLAAALAEAVGLGPSVVRDITAAALLHDVGKQSVPLEILTKQGPLTPEERAVVMKHPVDGAKILLSTPGVSHLARIVAFEHHMLLDGSGYPNRPRGRPIHLASRIVQLADVYDALRTHRPYRKAMTPKEVEETLLKGSGTSFDPDLLQEFLKAVGDRPVAGADSVPQMARPDAKAA
jgi:putative nucleotidyltransferase with HDIG domain